MSQNLDFFYSYFYNQQKPDRCKELTIITQQDYYDQQLYSTPLHSYYTGTYKEETALLFWSISAITM